jgi:hypothetical protein
VFEQIEEIDRLCTVEQFMRRKVIIKDRSLLPDFVFVSATIRVFANHVPIPKN